MGSLDRLYETYQTSNDAEQNGVWYEDSGVRFLLARMGGSNTKYQKALSVAMKPHLREMNLGLADDATIEKLMRRVFVSTILLDWDATDEKGDKIPLTAERVNTLFDELPDLYLRLREQASLYANYRAAALAAAAGN